MMHGTKERVGGSSLIKQEQHAKLPENAKHRYREFHRKEEVVVTKGFILAE